MKKFVKFKYYQKIANILANSGYDYALMIVQQNLKKNKVRAIWLVGKILTSYLLPSL